MAKKNHLDLAPSKNLSMNEYEELVEKWAIENSPIIFDNSTHDHAAIVLSKMFKYAKKEVLVYDDRLDSSLSDRHSKKLLSEIIAFLERGGSFKIVLRFSDHYKSSIYDLLKDRIPDSVFVASSNFKEGVKALFKKDIFFAVADGKAVRMELHETESTSSGQAVCSFNQPTYGQPLQMGFLNLLEGCPKFF